MYFRQLNIRSKRYNFVRWDTSQLLLYHGMDRDNIRRGDGGGWDYYNSSNKTSFKLEIIK